MTKEEISRRIREGVKAVIVLRTAYANEQVLEEEMAEHLAAGYRERTPSRRGERNGYSTRDLITPAGRIAQLRVPRDREGTFLTEVFERYKRMTGEVEEAVLEMYLQGVSTRKAAAITEGVSRVRIGKDAVSRVAQRLEEELSAWRGRPLELAYPYLYLDAAYFKVNWGGRVVDLALLVAVGVNEEGYREVLVVEPAGGERKEAWRNLLKGLVERGLRGVRLVISDDHPSIPQAERGVVAEELQEVFVARRRGTAESLARGFVERYRYRRAVEVFAQGLAAFPSGKHGEEALTYLDFPGVHQRHIKSTNVLERLIREVKRRSFPGEGSLVNLATVVMLRATEDWAFRRYLDMDPLWAAEEKPTKIAT
ncbi:transposase [Synechococcus sp. 'PEA 65AY6A-5F PE A']|uniref:IS256 family transposase n=1 Tax=Synechococcus sp. 'PEA 65AY6A-5F PE A' TaxID=1504259 RepID=UPI0039C2A75F